MSRDSSRVSSMPGMCPPGLALSGSCRKSVSATSEVLRASCTTSSPAPWQARQPMDS